MRIPSYRLHRASGQAIVTIHGKMHYLGAHGSPASEGKYRELIARYCDGKTVQHIPRTTKTVADLIDRYLREHVETEYLKHGKPTSERACQRSALRFLKAARGGTLLLAFGPRDLEAVRVAMIQDGQARSTINKHTHRIRAMFRWAARQDLLGITVYQKLLTVPALEAGRNHGAAEPEPVEPVAMPVLRATYRCLPKHLRDMVHVQWLSGARPGEIVIMRPGDLQQVNGFRSWLFRPQRHKTEHFGMLRTVPIGPRAQRILARYLAKRKPTEAVFLPARQGVNAHYTVDSYRKAIHRACELADVELWNPNQLRHGAAERIEEASDLETAGHALGHSDAATTLHYVRNPGLRKALSVMDKIG